MNHEDLAHERRLTVIVGARLRAIISRLLKNSFFDSLYPAQGRAGINRALYVLD
ncbi:MAG: hypothetical protein O7G83_14690 [Proteobacteria bacterium]|nr:hypothetical protein [Pseudomonadota bacterium]MCZ6894780.1 hypothetical protein [Gammaproteobacteria bacterium]